MFRVLNSRYRRFSATIGASASLQYSLSRRKMVGTPSRIGCSQSSNDVIEIAPRMKLTISVTNATLPTTSGTYRFARVFANVSPFLSSDFPFFFIRGGVFVLLLFPSVGGCFYNSRGFFRKKKRFPAGTPRTAGDDVHFAPRAFSSLWRTSRLLAMKRAMHAVASATKAIAQKMI